MSVRVAVVGLAGMGGYHAAVARRLDGYELVAVCDVVPDAMERAPDDVKRFDDPSELFASGVAEAVVLATPNQLHLDHVRAALGAGLHVYCEKPLGLTVGECREIATLAREADRRVQVGFQHRFQHCYDAAQALVSSGEVGELYRADLYATHWFRPHVYFAQRAWRGRWAEAGGGVLMLQAIHQLDAYLWICGMPNRVTAQVWRTRPQSQVEDEVSALLEFPNGARGVLVASTVSPSGRSRMELHGDRGTVFVADDVLRHGRLPDGVASILEHEQNPYAVVEVERETVEAPEGAALSFDDCVRANHRDFIEAIRDGRDPRSSPEQATRSVEVANAVYLSAVTRQPVDLPLDADAYAAVFAELCAGTRALDPLGDAR